MEFGRVDSKIIKAISQATTEYGSPTISQKEQLQSAKAEAGADPSGGVLAQGEGVSVIPTHGFPSCDRCHLLIPMGTKSEQIFLLNPMFVCLS